MSELEDWFARQLQGAGLPSPVREHVFAAPRKFRFDFAYPDLRIAVEIEGGVFVGGRHTRGKGFEVDLQKYNIAQLLGWSVLRFSHSFIKSGEAARMTAQLIQQRVGP